VNAHPAADMPPGRTAGGDDRTGALGWRTVSRFIGEFLAMCGVMCISGIVLSLLFFEGLGYSYLVQRAPAVAILVIVFSLTVPMAIYMAVRGHGWGHNLTMAASTAAVGLAVIAALSFGLIPARSLPDWSSLYGLVCGPACVLMFVQMLFSFGMYSGWTAHDAPAHGA
jgi:hypothetical protein